VPVPKSTKCAALPIEDKEDNPDRQDDQTDRPENDADLGEVAREQQDDTKKGQGAPSLRSSLYPRVIGFTQETKYVVRAATLRPAALMCGRSGFDCCGCRDVRETRSLGLELGLAPVRVQKKSGQKGA
jgi:hypothetical protein